MGKIKRDRPRRRRGSGLNDNKSFKALRNYISLKRQLKEANVVLNKAEKEYNLAAGTVADVESRIAAEVGVLRQQGQIVVANRNDVDAALELRKEHRCNGEIVVGPTAARAKVEAYLMDETAKNPIPNEETDSEQDV